MAAEAPFSSKRKRKPKCEFCFESDPKAEVTRGNIKCPKLPPKYP